MSGKHEHPRRSPERVSPPYSSDPSCCVSFAPPAAPASQTEFLSIPTVFFFPLPSVPLLPADRHRRVYPVILYHGGYFPEGVRLVAQDLLVSLHPRPRRGVAPSSARDDSAAASHPECASRPAACTRYDGTQLTGPKQGDRDGRDDDWATECRQNVPTARVVGESCPRPSSLFQSRSAALTFVVSVGRRVHH